VHATGQASLVRDAGGIHSILSKSVAQFEKNEPKPWSMESLPRDWVAELEQTIVGFEIRVESLETKLKLSQNRSEADRRGVLRGLESRTDEASRRVLAMMHGPLRID